MNKGTEEEKIESINKLVEEGVKSIKEISKETNLLLSEIVKYSIEGKVKLPPDIIMHTPSYITRQLKLQEMNKRKKEILNAICKSWYIKEVEERLGLERKELKDECAVLEIDLREELKKSRAQTTIDTICTAIQEGAKTEKEICYLTDLSETTVYKRIRTKKVELPADFKLKKRRESRLKRYVPLLERKEQILNAVPKCRYVTQVAKYLGLPEDKLKKYCVTLGIGLMKEIKKYRIRRALKVGVNSWEDFCTTAGYCKDTIVDYLREEEKIKIKFSRKKISVSFDSLLVGL